MQHFVLFCATLIFLCTEIIQAEEVYRSRVKISDSLHEYTENTMFRLYRQELSTVTDIPVLVLEHPSFCDSAAFSPDGKKVVSACRDGIVRIWDVGTGWMLQTIAAHKKAVRAVAFSPDGKKIVTVGNDDFARMWDVESGRFLKEFEGHTAWVESVAISPDCKKITTASIHDKTARIWDAESGKELVILEHEDRGVMFIGPTRVKTFKVVPYEITSVSFSPDGARIVTTGRDRSIRIWDTDSGMELKRFKSNDGFRSAVFSPDGRTVVTNSFIARLLDAESGKELQKFTEHASSVSCVAFSPDGKKLVTASRDTTARVWDIESGNVLRILRGHAGEVMSAAFSPDGKKVVTASRDDTVRIWTLEP